MCTRGILCGREWVMLRWSDVEGGCQLNDASWTAGLDVGAKIKTANTAVYSWHENGTNRDCAVCIYSS